MGQETADVWTYYAKSLNDINEIKINYTDVALDSWATNYINIVKDNSIMTGKTYSIFAPKDSLTRGEFATIIARALKLEIDNYNIETFKDTKNHWAQNYIEAIRREGLMIGNGDGTFEPDKPITREEVAKVLSLLKIDGLRSDESYYFKDISDKMWSFGYIIDAIQKGYMNGYPDNTFRPQQTISREEVAAVIVRVFQLH